jgi:hypothetical protein
MMKRTSKLTQLFILFNPNYSEKFPARKKTELSNPHKNLIKNTLHKPHKETINTLRRVKNRDM